MNNKHSASSSTDKRSRGINSGLTDSISVLHVDDEEVFLKVTKIYLEESTEGKIEVDSLINPEQVFRRLQKKAYDVIVVDFQMPSMDGLQLLVQLREKNITIPFIILTGRGREEVAIEALNLGADRYIKKGMDTESQFGELIHAIQEEVSHKRTQDALQESERKFRNIIKNLPLGVHIYELEPDGDLRFIGTNTAADKILGVDNTQYIGKTIEQAFPEIVKTEIPERFRTIASEGGFWKKEDIIYKDENFEGVFENYNFQTFPGIVVSLFDDITERKQAEMALRESEERLRAFMDSATYNFNLFDSKLNFVEINEISRKVFGLPKEEIIGKNIIDFNPELKGSDRLNKYFEVIKTGQNFFLDELEFKNRFFSIRAFKAGAGMGMVSTDITERKRTEKALQESEERFRRLSEASMEGIVIHDKGRILDANQAWLKMFGYDLSEKGTIDGFNLIIPKEREKVRRLVLSGSEESYEAKAVRKDGSTFPIEVRAKKIPFENQMMRVASVRDISERRQTEASLRKSEERLKTAVQIVKLGFWEWDIITGDLYWSDEGFRSIGDEPQSYKPSYDKFISMVHPEDVEFVQEQVDEALNNNKPYCHDFRYLYPNGEIRHFHTQGEVTYDKNGKAIRFVGTQQEITERIKFQKALQESEEKFRSIYAKSPLGIEVYNSDGLLFDANKACLDIFGVAEISEIMGFNLFEDPNLPDTQKKELKRGKAVKYETTFDFEKVRQENLYQTSKRGMIYLEVYIDPLISSDKLSSIGYLVHVQDITERKQMEVALQKSEIKFRNLFHKSTDAIFLSEITNDGKIEKFIEVNDVSCKRLGYSREELLTMSPRDIIAKEVHQKIPIAMQDFLTQGKITIELTHVSKSGRKIPVEINSQLITLEGEKRSLAVARDITERKRTEEELSESQELFTQFMDHLPAFAFIKDKDSKTLFANKYFKEVLGGEKWMGKSTAELFPEEVARKMIADDQKALNEGLQIITEELMDKYNVANTYQTYKFPIKQKNKNLLLGGIAINITEQKQAEEKLKAVNQELHDFTTIVAHDLKAPLRNITNLVDWVVRDLADDLSDEGKDNLNLIVKQTTHMDALIEGIHQYSHIDRVHRKIEPINLNELLSEVIEIIAPPDTIEIAIQTELPILAIDRTHMIQIFTNLLDNAVKFMDKPKGHIIINHEEKETFWQFSVRDNGPGIEERHFKRIFQMFQTLSTKEEAKGTGIGLAIVKKVIEMNGGEIWLESKVGKGSTFHITLPKH